MKKLLKRTLHVYIDSPTSNTHLKKFFPSNIKNLKFKIKFLNTALLNFKKENIKNFYNNSSKKDLPKNLIKIKSNIEFENYVKKIKHQDYLLILQRGASLEQKNFYDLDLFRKYKVKTITVDNLDPWVESNFKNNFLLALARTVHVYLKYFFKKIYLIKNYKPFYVLGCGKISKAKYLNKKYKNLNYIDCPSLTINFALKKRVNNIITYVDENLLFSRDAFIRQTNYKKIQNIDLYLRQLKFFFEKVEEKFKSKVIVACSNKFTYKKNYFNRPIVYGKTQELISKSKLVLGHRSTALFQALFNNVPVILIKNKYFPNIRNFQIENFAKTFFNQSPYYLDDSSTNIKDLKLNYDKKYYKNIINNYFKSKNLENKNFKDNFVKNFNRLI